MKKYDTEISQRSSSIIAIDADGVLLDYNLAYSHAWEKAFGELPALRDINAYWAMDRWNVRQLSGSELDKFHSCLDEEFWSSIPAIPNAIKACEELCNAGYELVCVSAIEPNFHNARRENIRAFGFPIERVIATSNKSTGVSPKAAALHELRPVAFVDDLLTNLRGIPDDIHAALILREPNGSPNVGEDLKLAHTCHSNLAEFASWWITRD